MAESLLDVGLGLRTDAEARGQDEGQLALWLRQAHTEGKVPCYLNDNVIMPGDLFTSSSWGELVAIGSTLSGKLISALWDTDQDRAVLRFLRGLRKNSKRKFVRRVAWPGYLWGLEDVAAAAEGGLCAACWNVWHGTGTGRVCGGCG